MATLQKQTGRAPRTDAAQTFSDEHTSLVCVRGGELVTDSRTIAHEFGRRHDHVLCTLDSLIADGMIDRPNFGEISYTDEMNRQQRMIELDERGALIAMPFIGGRNSRVGQSRLVDSFLAMRRELSARTAPDRLAARRDAATNYALLSEMLALTREAEGKATQGHHYANEARLVNQAFSGVFGPLDRDAMNVSDLRILNRLQVRDAALIGMGKSYDERKSLLTVYAALLRTPKLSGGVQ
ncbi:Rha family transcriptional regulator [Paraburkholderia sp. Ac-20342]|uniref:Rha family transcriptional regulator n=1 Tax=Paraburkholderia sp. Ac-20342 TaxID=2703889 RepID=UPI00197ED45D|nr:Rha family transcriptional regulator [Paraburkholderia sp. Ac-20342]MBN3851465.1 Rha family transcriptional regulator [Paraburkholderia sp. Ac-20342]